MPSFIVPKALATVEYEDAPHLTSDILIGPEVELSPEGRERRRQRIQNHANSYLKGSDLFIASANLKGPFDDMWNNLWLEKTGADARDQHQPEGRTERPEQSIYKTLSESRAANISQRAESTRVVAPPLSASNPVQVGTAYNHRLLSPFDQFYRSTNTGSQTPTSSGSFYLLTPTSTLGTPIEVREPRRLYPSETGKSTGSTVSLNSTICERSGAAQSMSVSTRPTTTRSARANKNLALETNNRCHRPQIKPPAHKPLPKTKIATQSSSNRYPNGPISNKRALRRQITDGNPSIQLNANPPHVVDTTLSHQEIESPSRLNAPRRKPFRLGELLEPDSSPEQKRPTPSSQGDVSLGHRLDKPPQDEASHQDVVAAAEAITLKRSTTDRPQPNPPTIRPSTNQPTPPFSAVSTPQPPPPAHQAPTQQSTSTNAMQPDVAQTQSTNHISSQWTPINTPRPPAARLSSPALAQIPRWAAEDGRSAAAGQQASANAMGEGRTSGSGVVEDGESAEGRRVE